MEQLVPGKSREISRILTSVAEDLTSIETPGPSALRESLRQRCARVPSQICQTAGYAAQHTLRNCLRLPVSVLVECIVLCAYIDSTPAGATNSA